jgi:hypothetical protein
LFANQQNRQFRDEKEYLIDSTSSVPRRMPWSLASAKSLPKSTGAAFPTVEATF